MKQILIRSLLMGTFVLGMGACRSWAQDTLVICDFESYPNNLEGVVAVEGDGAPDWNDPNAINGWYYGEEVKGFDPANVYEGQVSFRCVNGGTSRPMESWATFYLLMGPVLDAEAFPAKIQSMDVSSYRNLRFWAKGAAGGEHLNVVFRDASAANNFPQARFDPFPQGMKPVWQEVVVPLLQVKNSVDLSQLVMVGIEFGTELGNKKGNIFYIDKVELVP
jgi:hypothetical protein